MSADDGGWKESGGKQLFSPGTDMVVHRPSILQPQHRGIQVRQRMGSEVAGVAAAAVNIDGIRLGVHVIHFAACASRVTSGMQVAYAVDLDRSVLVLALSDDADVVLVIEHRADLAAFSEIASRLFQQETLFRFIKRERHLLEQTNNLFGNVVDERDEELDLEMRNSRIGLETSGFSLGTR
jgi:hypothetical protein